MDKFGWDNLGIKSEKSVFGSYWDYGGYDKKTYRYTAKRPKYELDRFVTAEEACRFFFDTATIEEAIWDLVGIPRLLILNSDRWTMEVSPWKICNGRDALGDKSVKMGSRVAHAYFDGWCTVWKEG